MALLHITRLADTSQHLTTAFRCRYHRSISGQIFKDWFTSASGSDLHYCCHHSHLFALGTQGMAVSAPSSPPHAGRCIEILGRWIWERGTGQPSSKFRKVEPSCRLDIPCKPPSRVVCHALARTCSDRSHALPAVLAFIRTAFCWVPCPMSFHSMAGISPPTGAFRGTYVGNKL